ncbi:hypothetical protein Q5P01_010688 [Channa striata]|uniref:Uncharacterized protein n=1 Tax=Channa striata TaxID=64152 RepID=A0AA88MTA5_CHASR|nr:hypothetical protein Q5P01_010688 [Channa striata]
MTSLCTNVSLLLLCDFRAHKLRLLSVFPFHGSPQRIICLHLTLSSTSSSLTPATFMSSLTTSLTIYSQTSNMDCRFDVLIPDPIHPCLTQREPQHLELCLLSFLQCHGL